MREPPRLHEDCHGQVERALLEAGRNYRAADRARTKTLAALGLTVSAAATAASAAATVAASASPAANVSWLGVGWAKFALGVSAVGALAAPVAYLAWPAPAAPTQVVAENRQPRTPRTGNAGNGSHERTNDNDETMGPSIVPRDVPKADTGTVVPPARSADELGLISRGGSAQRGNVARPSAPPAKTVPSKGSPSAILSAELAMVEGARSLLSNGDARSALSVLDTYSRMYAHGHLELEAEVLRIDALSRSGQPDAASKRAETFLRKHPNSVLANRVRGFLAD
jgi:hypothetical protein